MQTVLTPNTNYRSFLRLELERRCKQNPRYSLNAFARDLGLAPSRLSEVFSEKQGLSREVATRISEKIGLNQDETETFCDLVEMEHARSAEKRAEGERERKTVTHGLAFQRRPVPT